ncbi:MAG TPA: molecular chaperone HscC [Allosphingosinicella sp.]|jgi:molecular chaperone HscC
MIIGIDLGTTNSAAAVWRDGASVLIPNRLGQVLTPSAVSIDESGTVLVGMAARERQASHPRQTVTAFKRYMGTARNTDLGGRRFSPEELSALVLRSLKSDAEAFLGEPVREAVITVPAYFNDKQRKATRRAGELAGLKVERLVNEPTAAALAYGIHNLAEESRFLVFDLGGGTFDVSVLEIFEGVIEVRASTGDNRLGGEDFNEIIVAILRERFGDGLGAWAKQDDAVYQKLREHAERARRELSGAAETMVRMVWGDREHEAVVTAEEFEEKAAPLIARLREPVLRALRDSELRPETLSEIVLIGGATRMPIVRKTVARMFGRFPNATVNPDEAVALGAAVQAGLKARDSALKEVVLTDVCPFSLGVETARPLPGGGYEEGIFVPVIERNTTVPASRSKIFETVQRNQTMVRVRIFQGESRSVHDNVGIGELDVPVPRGPAGKAVECRFSYDINGLLEVDVVVPETGERRQLVIADPDVEVDPAELERRRQALAALKVHPRDQEANRTALARAERCWQDSLAEKREHVDMLIAQFKEALETQDPRICAAACETLNGELDRLEGASFL